ncbi:MAG: FTR1 family iron permease, partial [Roseiarcus sp.]
MLAALIIVFRETLEAGLVVGVVLAATRGVPGRGFWIASGVGAGVAGACLVAAFASRIATLFEGSGQEAFNASILIVAVVMLCWHNAWMANHGRDLARDLKAVGRDVAEGRRPLTALAVVCGVAVLREGSEVVLFLYGVAAGGGATAWDILA